MHACLQKLNTQKCCRTPTCTCTCICKNGSPWKFPTVWYCTCHCSQDSTIPSEPHMGDPIVKYHHTLIYRFSYCCAMLRVTLEKWFGWWPWRSCSNWSPKYPTPGLKHGPCKLTYMYKINVHVLIRDFSLASIQSPFLFLYKILSKFTYNFFSPKGLLSTVEKATLDREKEVGLFILYKLTKSLVVHNTAPFKGTCI